MPRALLSKFTVPFNSLVVLEPIGACGVGTNAFTGRVEAANDKAHSENLVTGIISASPLAFKINHGYFVPPVFLPLWRTSQYANIDRRFKTTFGLLFDTMPMG